MSLFERFLTSTSGLLGSPLTDRENELAKLNPDKFYVENVRSVFKISHKEAKRLCETAVRQGTFVRGVEVLCPDDVVAAVAQSEAELPPIVRCMVEHDNEFEEIEYDTATLRKMTFYKFNDGHASEAFRQTA